MIRIPAAPLLLAFALAPANPAAAEFLYGVTETHLVEIDPTDPSQVRPIGPHGLAADLAPAYLAYEADSGRLIGRAARDLGGGADFDFVLVEYDLTTGAGTELLDLGTLSVDGTFEALEYVDSLGSLVVAAGPPGSSLSNQFVTLDADTGATSPLVSGAPDNDNGAWDEGRGIFYVWDGNDVGLFQTLDLGNGDLTNLAAIPTDYVDGAFSEDDGGLFLFDRAAGTLVHADTNEGVGPVVFTPVGLLAGDPVTGLAFSPVPEPGCGAALAFGAALLVPFAARRRLRHP